jgi:hypothetical protein
MHTQQPPYWTFAPSMPSNLPAKPWTAGEPRAAFTIPAQTNTIPNALFVGAVALGFTGLALASRGVIPIQSAPRPRLLGIGPLLALGP